MIEEIKWAEVGCRFAERLKNVLKTILCSGMSADRGRAGWSGTQEVYISYKLTSSARAYLQSAELQCLAADGGGAARGGYSTIDILQLQLL